MALFKRKKVHPTKPLNTPLYTEPKTPEITDKSGDWERKEIPGIDKKINKKGIWWTLAIAGVAVVGAALVAKNKRVQPAPRKEEKKK